jgi:diadenylate cyclase
MQTIAVYVGERRHVLEGSAVVLSRANQALATLERYKARLDEVTATLSALEVEDFVTIRDVTLVIQRHEMVRRISEEVSTFVVELGTDGRLLSLQLEELIGGVGVERDLVVGDYLPADDRHRLDETLGTLAKLSSSELLDAVQVSGALGYPMTAEALDESVSPRGHRLLAKIPRLPRSIADRLVEHFGGLQALLMASQEDLMAVDGVGEARARTVREGVARLAESSILERYA